MTQIPTVILKNRAGDIWCKDFDSNSVFNDEFIRSSSSELFRTPSRGPSPLKLEEDFDQDTVSSTVSLNTPSLSTSSLNTVSPSTLSAVPVSHHKICLDESESEDSPEFLGEEFFRKSSEKSSY